MLIKQTLIVLIFQTEVFHEKVRLLSGINLILCICSALQCFRNVLKQHFCDHFCDHKGKWRKNNIRRKDLWNLEPKKHICYNLEGAIHRNIQFEFSFGESIQSSPQTCKKSEISLDRHLYDWNFPPKASKLKCDILRQTLFYIVNNKTNNNLIYCLLFTYI